MVKQFTHEYDNLVFSDKNVHSKLNHFTISELGYVLSSNTGFEGKLAYRCGAVGPVSSLTLNTLFVPTWAPLPFITICNTGQWHGRPEGGARGVFAPPGFGHLVKYLVKILSFSVKKILIFGQNTNICSLLKKFAPYKNSWGRPCDDWDLLPVYNYVIIIIIIINFYSPVSNTRCHSIGHKMRIARIKIRVDSPGRWERA